MFLIPTSVCPKSYLFCSSSVQKLFSRKLDFHKGSFIHGWLSKSVFSSGSWDHSQEGLNLVHGPQPGLRSVYHLPHGWVTLLPGSLVYVTGTQISLKGTSIHGLMLNFCCWVGENTRDATMMLMSPTNTLCFSFT